MTEVQIIKAFILVCTVIPVVVQVGWWLAKVKRRSGVAPMAGCIAARDFGEFAEMGDELLRTVSISLGVRREQLTPEASFRDDLRIPPGELEALLEELRGDYGIFIDSKEIKKVGDILRLIRVEQDPS